MGCTKPAEMTNLMSIMAAMIQKAKRGDVKAANFIKDIVADKEANTAVRSLRKTIEVQIGTESSDELFEALMRLADIERQYYYRLEMQEGFFLQNNEFLTEGL